MGAGAGGATWKYQGTRKVYRHLDAGLLLLIVHHYHQDTDTQEKMNAFTFMSHLSDLPSDSTGSSV